MVPEFRIIDRDPVHRGRIIHRHVVPPERPSLSDTGFKVPIRNMPAFICSVCKTHDGGQRVTLLSETAEKKCSKCGGASGQFSNSEQFMAQLEAGAIFSYDAKGRRQEFPKRKARGTGDFE
jgi:hypothetical protein